ncbi:multidrug efflux RND transporter permease subunit [Candidatus Paracaedibacter symbiosus]|uniref:multidrug efflux RND transporter permease subunit n=1 Tax=Candidatus Paracaedibacter symbiosus TaxID=244582 RepID=UPI00094E83CF|nr:multidrug efflux RND transporter permease subunit [Candidatus Paracaedibacter symbiosus]
MNISIPFIRRPIGTTLLAFGLALAGILAFNLMPVSPLPQIEFPTISIQATLPGAAPETMATSVATPLERQLGRIAGITEITSSSRLGTAQITLQFDLSRNINGAARDVQAAINAARSNLPADLPSNPTYKIVNPSDAPIIILALTSDTYSSGQMYDIASTILQQKLSQVNGVGQVIVGGSSLPAVRLELNPTALNKYGISLEQVRTAVAAANNNRPKGQLSDEMHSYIIMTNDQLFKAADYQPLIISYQNSAPIRLSDLGEVIDSVEDLRNAGLSNGKPSVLLIIFKQPGANIIGTVDNVKSALRNLKADIPAAIDLSVVMDRTTTIRASLKDVEFTLILAVCLVIWVIYLFLGNFRAALIPSVVVPLSLLGTFCVMYLCGFSLDNLSLMAMTIATGFVVDDAVVVLENISRHIEAGLKPIQAAILGAKEVGFTVLSMSASLIAVFIPILLMGGIVGRLFREFALTLSIAILMSMVVSLTVTPMMSAYILKPEKKGHHQGRVMNFMMRHYRQSLGWALRRPKFMLTLTAATIASDIFLFVIIPKGFFPQQDVGRIVASIQAQQDISFQALKQKLNDYVKIVKDDPAVETVVGFIGGNSASGNAGTMYISLKPLEERKLPIDDIMGRLRGKLAAIPGASVYMRATQDLVIGGRQSNALYQYTLTSYDLNELNTWAPRVLEKLATLPGIVDVNSDQLSNGKEVFVTIDRDAASRLGVSPQTIDNTLYDAFGQRQIAIMYTALNQYHVVMELAPQYWQRPETLDLIYAPSATNNQIPLSVVTKSKISNTLLLVNHQGQFPAATISFNLLPGYSLGQAVEMINEATTEIGMPKATMHGSFQGTAQAFQDSLSSQPLLILAALIAVYIVLGILYESTIHPITILSTLPSAGIGAMIALLLTGTELSIIAIIGMILLIGIVKKNAIMMIDFALEKERQQHKSAIASIYEACLLRFRPIMMTTMAAILSAVPLAFGSGVGSELRKPLGISIIGGLIFSQMLTLYTTPVIYLSMERVSSWWKRRHKQTSVVVLPLLLLLLNACEVGPDYVRPVIETPAQFKEPPAGWKFATPQDTVDRGTWWDMFNDPLLSNLVAEVELTNQNLALAEAQHRQSQALVDQARAGFFPTINATTSATRQKSFSTGSTNLASAPTNLYNVGLNATWELDVWGSVRRSVESSEAGAEAAAANVALTKLSSEASLTQFYYELRAVDATQKLLDETVGSYQKLLVLTQNRHRMGVSTGLDIAQAESQLKTAEVKAIDNKVTRAQYEHAIAVLVGKAASDFSIPVDSSALPEPPTLPSALPATLMERRPDIAQAERQMAQANATIGVNIAAYFPNLTLNGSGGYESTLWHKLFTAPSQIWSMAGQMAQLVFDGGLVSGKVEAARAAYDQSVANYRQVVLTAFQETEDNLAALRILESEIKSQVEAVKAAKKQLNLTINEYKSGTIYFSDVMTAEINYFTARSNYIAIAARRLTATASLVKSLGGGWCSSDLIREGNWEHKPSPTQQENNR